MSVRYVFLAAEGFPSTVYSSQVGDFLQVLDRAGLRFDVINFDPLYPQTTLTPAGRARVAELRRAVPGRLTVRPYVPYEDRLGTPFARRILGWDLIGAKPTVIHARGVWAAAMAARIAQRRRWVKVVYDVRGDYIAEHALHHAGHGDERGLRVRLGQWRIGRAEARACEGAGRILCVSRVLRSVLEDRYPGAGVKAAVVPGCFDPAKFQLNDASRREWRERLGLEDRFVIAYAGSMISYQLPGSIARTGAQACRLRKDAHLLVLTPEVEKARQLMREGGLSEGQFTCRKVRHAEMPGALNAADLGLLLRRPDPVNRVASPTKAAEYMACGTPLLVSDGIGDISQLVASEGVGAVLPTVDDDERLRATLEALLGDLPAREHVAGVARQKLARDRYLPTYLDLYGQLANAALRAAGTP